MCPSPRLRRQLRKQDDVVAYRHRPDGHPGRGGGGVQPTGSQDRAVGGVSDCGGQWVARHVPALEGHPAKAGGKANLVYNIEMGPPAFAPLLAAMVGGMGLLAALLRREGEDE
jgi:hypothetical protein